MPKFRISSHGRLQDWIAAEKGFFEEESLDYEIDVRALENSAQDIAADAHQDIRTGAYELYLSGADTDPLDVERYFRALKRAQMELDLEPERYKHHYLKEMPERYHAEVDVRCFGPGERVVFLPYSGRVSPGSDRPALAPSPVGHFGHELKLLLLGILADCVPGTRGREAALS